MYRISPGHQSCNGSGFELKNNTTHEDSGCTIGEVLVVLGCDPYFLNLFMSAIVREFKWSGAPILTKYQTFFHAVSHLYQF
jgi:hypothetical protein